MPELTEESLEDFYRTLKRYQQRVHADQRLPAPPADSVSVRSRLCGSALTLDAVIAQGRVQQLGWSVHACALGQACTGIVAGRLADLDEATVRRVGAQLRAILKGERDTSDWPELAMFALVRDVPNRHGSALLPFEALRQLFDRAHARG